MLKVSLTMFKLILILFFMKHAPSCICFCYLEKITDSDDNATSLVGNYEILMFEIYIFIQRLFNTNY